MGDFGTSTSSSSGSTSSAPTTAQMPFIQQGWDTALANLKNAQGVSTPTNFVAGFNPAMVDAFKSMIGYGMGGSTAGTSAAGSALTLSMRRNSVYSSMCRSLSAAKYAFSVCISKSFIHTPFYHETLELYAIAKSI